MIPGRRLEGVRRRGQNETMTRWWRDPQSQKNLLAFFFSSALNQRDSRMYARERTNLLIRLVGNEYGWGMMGNG